MNVAQAACAPSGQTPSWDRIDWTHAEREVRRLQARIVKAVQAGRRGKVKALQRLDAEEQRLQDERTARVERIERWRATADAAGVVLGLLGAFLAVQLFSNGIVRRVLGLQQNADRLAEGLPLVPSPEGEDEIGALARHLEKAAGLLLERSRALRIRVKIS